jgi:hypothetical protein
MATTSPALLLRWPELFLRKGSCFPEIICRMEILGQGKVQVRGNIGPAQAPKDAVQLGPNVPAG